MNISPSPSNAEYWLTAAARQPELRPCGIPLSPGCFQATNADRERYATLIRGRVDSMLQDEAHYADRNEPLLHAEEWKQVKKEKGLTFYRRCRRGRSLRDLALEEELPEIQRAVERGYTTVICDGVVKGSIEDMLYGMTASSQDELMTGFSYKHPPKDCVWLGSVASATRADPFHTVDLVWALPKLSPVLDQVDICYLKATGQQVDANGERYGYLVLHSVHIAQCPAFDAHKISRAKMYFACLFREPQAGILKVTVRGIFDLSKKVTMLTGLVSAATTSIMVGLLNGVGIGQAKKLTLLARRKRSRLRDLSYTRRQAVCYMCCKRASFLGRVNLFGTHFATCYVCGGTVCSNCTRGVKQRVFLGTANPCSKVECCPNCMREAVTTIHVRPAEPEFQVVAEFYQHQHLASALPEHSHGLKTNSSAGLLTASTTGGSLGEYQFEFDDDPFSISLALPELRPSSGGDVSIDAAIHKYELDSTAEAEAEASSLESSIAAWEGGRHFFSIDDDDFIPSITSDNMPSDRLSASAKLAARMEQRLLELRIQAEHTYATTMRLREGK